MTPYRYTCLQDPHFTNEETEAEKGQVTGIKVKKPGEKPHGVQVERPGLESRRSALIPRA